jgi:hypothetical protein
MLVVTAIEPVETTWALDEFAQGRVTVGDLNKRLHATRALVSAAFSVSPVLEAPRQFQVPESPPNEAALL